MSEAPPLPVERLFAAPPLSGRVPQLVSFSPDGVYLAFLLGAEDDHTRLELWLTDVASGEQHNMTPRLDTADAELTDAERDQRERRRIFSHGVVEYEWLPDSSGLIVPLSGTPYRCGLDGSLVAIGDGRPVSHTALSPNGRQLAAVSEGNLVLIGIDDGAVRVLTDDGSNTVTNGLPEFIAQEEMHRHVGFWWAPDGASIAFTRVDESPVALSRRYDIGAGEIRMIEQRYPYAGAANAAVELHVVHLVDGNRRPLYSVAPDAYLARVTWVPGADALLLVTQNRLQDVLRLQHLTVTSPASTPTVISEERSPTWINLYDAPRFIDDDRFVWQSERDGFCHLYLGRTGPNENLIQLTQGEWMVERVVDTSADAVWFSGWRETPVERHLYRLTLADGSITALTTLAGCHDCTVSRPARRIADQHSACDTPPHLGLLDLDGQPAGSVIDNSLADPAHPFHAWSRAAPEVRFMTLTADDGQTLHARLTLPPDFDPAGRWPALVHVYGGPGVQRVTNVWQLGWPQYLARRGWVIFELDNRGSSGRGRAFEAPIHRHMGRVELDDQLAGARWLRDQPWIDAGRIGVYGHSYGGYMALMCLARAGEVFRAAISVAPVSSWRLYDTHYTERYLGLPDDNTDGYEASDVFGYLDGIGGPLLLMHGMADDNVLFTHTTRLMKALQDANTPFELMTYPGSKHGLAETSVSIHRFNHMTQFLERHLGGAQ